MGLPTGNWRGGTAPAHQVRQAGFAEILLRPTGRFLQRHAGGWLHRAGAWRTWQLRGASDHDRVLGGTGAAAPGRADGADSCQSPGSCSPRKENRALPEATGGYPEDTPDLERENAELRGKVQRYEDVIQRNHLWHFFIRAEKKQQCVTMPADTVLS